MSSATNRRHFLRVSAAAAGCGLAGAMLPARAADDKPLYKISLAQWSLNRALFDGRLDNLDFAKVAKREFDIDAVEYVNQFFKDKAEDKQYLADMKQRAEDHGVRSLLIMIDGEGDLGDPDDAGRKRAVEKHYRWVEAAKFLGCHSIRVNAASKGSYEEQQKLAADGLRRLSQFAGEHGLNVLVENHGGLSSNGEWLAETIRLVGLDNCGTLPDFGNFGDFDRYRGVKLLMPLAKAVSAKSHAFDENGNETTTDYLKMMKIVVDAGYRGYVGVEFEGRGRPAPEGIMLTKKLLLRVRDELSG